MPRARAACVGGPASRRGSARRGGAGTGAPAARRLDGWLGARACWLAGCAGLGVAVRVGTCRPRGGDSRQK
ncbi:Hypothetical predicted protein [Marmota monax]|uniref:Uncharacterized protein n=1 Tax=Marmota monax TaxID=9995 RepID=A0A5E4CFE7_MARMO|nr:Hypothetical predicted protein [Marmota monax]